MWKILSVFSLALMIFLGGCAAAPENRYTRLQSRYPGWDEQTLQRVADRQVAVGMTEEMVLAARGKPSLKEGNLWKYMTYEVDGYGYTYPVSTYSVYFKDKKVKRTEDGAAERLGQ